MTTGEFTRQLRVLNPALKVCSFAGSQKLAGLYYIDKTGDYFDICGVDKGFVEEYSRFDEQGHIVHSGWRRVFQILLALNLTSPRKIQKVCPGFFLHWNQAQVDADRKKVLVGDPIQAKIQKYSAEAPVLRWKDPDSGRIEEGTALTDEQNLDIANDIRKKDSQHQQEQDEKNRWFLKTWANRGGNITDKPKI